MKLLPIRRIPDDLWVEIAAILGKEKEQGTRGRPPVSFRKVLDGIPYVLRTGLPVEVTTKRIRIWLDVPQKIPAMDERRSIRKDTGQAPEEVRRCQGDQVEVAVARFKFSESTFRGEKTGPNPTDRAKLGVKRHILTDQRGTPLSAVITGANVHDIRHSWRHWTA